MSFWNRFLIRGKKKSGASRSIPEPDEVSWRHEHKYELSVNDLAVIRSRVRAIAETDPHTGSKGWYRVRSLYFDNDHNQALMEKIDGLNPREKFRIRYYDNNLSWVRLEKKVKKNGLGIKFSEGIRPEDVQDIISGTNAGLPYESAQADSGHSYQYPLLLELYSKMRTLGLRPKVIVEYHREPYLYFAGNVRVTFDYNLRVSPDIEQFLKPDYWTIPAAYPARCLKDSLRVMGGNGVPESVVNDFFPVSSAPIIMEVKWDHFLPLIVEEAIRRSCLPTQSFSKYAQCRSFF